MDNDTYILMGGRGVKKNPYQTLNALKLYEENERLKRALREVKEFTIRGIGCADFFIMRGIISSIRIIIDEVLDEI